MARSWLGMKDTADGSTISRSPPRFAADGIGNQLMERAEEILRAVGCPKINLLVRVGNEPELSRFYAGLGFRLDEVVCYGKRLEVDQRSWVLGEQRSRKPV